MLLGLLLGERFGCWNRSVHSDFATYLESKKKKKIQKNRWQPVFNRMALMGREQTEQQKDKREQRSAITATLQKRVDRDSPEMGPQRLLGQNSHSCPVGRGDK